MKFDDISEEIKEQAKTAIKEGNWKNFSMETFVPELMQVRGITSREARKLGSQFKAIIESGEITTGEQEREEVEDSQRKSLNRILLNSFNYGNKRMKLEDVESGGFSTAKVQVKAKRSPNLEEKIDELYNYATETGDDIFKKNVESLARTLVDVLRAQEEKERPKYKKLDINWAENVGDLPLGNWPTREKVYDYWETIYDKHANMIEATDLMMDEYEKFDDLDSEFDSFVEKMKDLQKIYSKGIPNYVEKTSSFELTVPNTLTTAIRVLNHYLDLKGVISPDEISEDEEELGEREQRYGAKGDYDRSGASVADPTKYTNKDIEDINLGATTVRVDPIFHYEYNKDYSDIKIPREQLSAVSRKLAEGLMFHYLDDEDLEEFDDWFESFTDEMKKAGEKREYYLPLSPFVLNYYQDKNHPNKEKAMEKDDITLDFLEAIGELIEEQKTMFSLYQKRISEDESVGGSMGDAAKTARNRIIGLGERFTAARSGKKRANPLENMASSNELQEIEDVWDNFLEAINEYYLLPTQGKNYIQTKEKPRWAVGHASLILSIQNAERNPFGKLLNNLVSKGINIIKPKSWRDIRIFIEKARSSGARKFDRKIWNEGKRAVKALDAIFGKEFHDENMESIGYIIYDIGKKLEVYDALKEPPSYWENIEELYDDYENAPDTKTYPLEQLRRALNSPEFDAWMNWEVSEKKEGTEGIDPKLKDEIKQLDAVFDTFHKMDAVNSILLDAHDAIRKMENKPVIHSRLSLDSIDHMDLIINKIQKEQRMDLTATEVNKIVKAVSSYESISRDFGINEETVYTVKALFR